MSKEKKHLFTISEEDGFIPFENEGISGKVFIRDGLIYKISARNSLARQQSDLRTLQSHLVGFEDHLPPSTILTCIYEGQEYVCVVQPFIKGATFKQLGEEASMKALREDAGRNRAFLLKLLEYLFEALPKKELIPDIVGYPAGFEFYNSINLILETATNKIFLCDVGLSPHEDTLQARGEEFYYSDHMKRYAEKMARFRSVLLALGEQG